MANLKFLKGNYSSLGNAAITEGQILVTKDTRELFVDVDASTRIKIGDFTIVATLAELEALDATKVPTSRLYYVEDGNILARSNGTTWIQVNKQKTADELKTMLGLGSMAYVSTVVEDNLSTELQEKINASAEGNHAHTNKAVLDGITAEKVTAWDAAEGNAKTYADGLNTAMDARVQVVEGTSHTHTNKALLDTYTQTEADLADAVAKKHEHANKTELDKIVAGDKAKWDAVVADHLTSTDKTALEDSIGDVNTALGEEVTRAKAAEKANSDAIAAIKDGTTVDSFADVETELAKKVDKETGKSLVADTEIARLAAMSDEANKVEASEINGNIKIDGVETTVYTHPAKHNITDIEGLQDALDGKQGSGDYAAEDHKHVKADITDFAHTHTASEVTDLDATIKTYNYATKAEAQAMADGKDEAIAAAKKAGDDAQADVDALKTYVGTFTASEGVDTVVKYIDAKTANIASDETVSALADRVKAIEDDYLVEADKTELAGLVTAEKTRAEGIEAGLRTDVDAIKGDYLKAADKTALTEAITAEETRAKGVEADLQTQINTIMNNPDAEGAINSINEFTKYVQEHGTIADGFRTDIDKNKEDIAANTKAIADQATSDAATYETKTDATAKLTKAKGYTDTEVAAAKTAAANQDAVILAEAQTYTDQAEANAIATAATDASNKVDDLANGQVATNKADIAALTTTVAKNAAAATKAVEDLAAAVYTQEQVDALIADACSWGSF